MILALRFFSFVFIGNFLFSLMIAPISTGTDHMVACLIFSVVWSFYLAHKEISTYDPERD